MTETSPNIVAIGNTSQTEQAPTDVKVVLLAVCALGITVMALMQGYQFYDYASAKYEYSKGEPLRNHKALMQKLGLE